MKFSVAVALSGGVDSTAAAALLQDAGHQVAGVHFFTGFEGYSRPFEKDPKVEKLRQIAESINVPLFFTDLSPIFESRVVQPFVSQYLSGKTPNPCILCNPAIKFGALKEFAGKIGARRFATGHYARLKKDPGGIIHLKKGADAKKDQSYFLSRLNQENLRHVLFPLGEYTKDRVKEIAVQKGLASLVSKDSQEVCFIANDQYREFLAARSQLPGPGPIQTMEGEVIGSHPGVHAFTVGQRRGLDCPSSEPWYVVRLEPQSNTVVVGRKTDLLSGSCLVERVSWVGAAKKEDFFAGVRIRYRHKEVPAQVSLLDKGTVRVLFEEPQNAVTPGQAAVLYEGGEVLGGGWISN